MGQNCCNDRTVAALVESDQAVGNGVLTYFCTGLHVQASLLMQFYNSGESSTRDQTKETLMIPQLCKAVWNQAIDV